MEVVGVVKVIVVARGEVVKIVEVNPCPHEGATSPQLLGRHQEAKGLVHAAAKFREELWRSGLAWKSRAMWHSEPPTISVSRSCKPPTTSSRLRRYCLGCWWDLPSCVGRAAGTKVGSVCCCKWFVELSPEFGTSSTSTSEAAQRQCPGASVQSDANL